ncbi:MAG: transposase, partial [Acidobacteria bacterium]|nr:transposase [Acidobacteriota bacterium]
MIKKADKLRQPPTPSFVAEFELESNSAGCTALEKRLNAYRQVYNAILGELHRRLKRARKSAEWEAARKLPKGSPERKVAFAEVRRKYGLSVGEAQKIAQRLSQGHLKELTNSRIVQQVAKRAWRAIEKVMFGKANRVRFKRRDEFHSFETNANDTGIRVVIGTGTVCVGKLTFEFKADETNPYHVHALKHRVKYTRIVKRVINGRSRWYVQLILEGKTHRDPEKHTTQNGERVGLDFGPSLMAVSTATESFQESLGGELDRREAEIRRLQRRLGRSRRATNPHNYQSKGTVKKGRKRWHQSSRYRQTRQQLKDLERRKAAHRKSLHGRLANRIVRFGNQIHTEKVSYRGWQKQFGRSIQHHAPSALEGILTRKAEALGGGSVKINTFQTALSQTCLCGNRKKKSLSERTHRCTECGFTAPRDEFSAYLALHTSWTDGKWVVNLDEARSGI